MLTCFMKLSTTAELFNILCWLFIMSMQSFHFARILTFFWSFMFNMFNMDYNINININDWLHVKMDDMRAQTISGREVESHYGDGPIIAAQTLNDITNHRWQHCYLGHTVKVCHPLFLHGPVTVVWYKLGRTNLSKSLCLPECLVRDIKYWVRSSQCRILMGTGYDLTFFFPVSVGFK